MLRLVLKNLALWLLVGALSLTAGIAASKPRIFVFTDINIDAGDPDDRQSLVHLLWYADELEITGIVPDRWDARGYEACQLALAAYAQDFVKQHWQERGYPSSHDIENLIARSADEAGSQMVLAAQSSPEPLWVLIWGNMELFGRTLRAHPEIADRLRVVSIGTGLMYEPDRQHLPTDWEEVEPCRQPNWNSAGRNEFFHDARFDRMWWLEINWTYNGMFAGGEPKEMFDRLTAFGALGQHLQDVTINQSWAQYFRVGDTPSVLFVIDPTADRDDPTQSSWAGQFARPFPNERPNYFTDSAGAIPWNYAEPCASWEHLEEVYQHAKGTLERERPEMYQALLTKLGKIYQTASSPIAPR